MSTYFVDIKGSSSNDTLTGSSNSDAIEGLAGDDILLGLQGSDLLLGRSGDDTLIGGKGVDRLDGGFGNNVLVGGAGNDVFSFGLAWLPDSERITTDTILDFTNNKDLLRITGITFDKLLISPVTNGTLIRRASDGKVLATLVGVASDLIGPEDFFDPSII